MEFLVVIGIILLGLRIWQINRTDRVIINTERPKKQHEAKVDLINMLQEIGMRKRFMDAQQRRLADGLGLVVSLHDGEYLQNPYRKELRVAKVVGFNTTQYVFLRSDDSGTKWEEIRFDVDSWVRLIKPTLRLAIWINSQNELNEHALTTYYEAIETFKRSGDLPLDVDQEQIERWELHLRYNRPSRR